MEILINYNEQKPIFAFLSAQAIYINKLAINIRFLKDNF